MKILLARDVGSAIKNFFIEGVIEWLLQGAEASAGNKAGHVFEGDALGGVVGSGNEICLLNHIAKDQLKIF